MENAACASAVRKRKKTLGRRRKKETAFFQKASEGDGVKENLVPLVILVLAPFSILVPDRSPAGSIVAQRAIARSDELLDHRSMTPRRTRRTYDHRFRQLVRETGDLRPALRNGVPRSTARDWSR